MIEYERARHLLVDEMLNRTARRFPKKVAFVDGDEKITYQQLINRVNNLAGWLQQNGIEKGDKVGLLLYNSLEYIECFYALARIGAIIVPINFRLQLNEWEYIINNAEVKMMIIHADFSASVDRIKNSLPLIQSTVIVNSKETVGISYSSIFERKHFLQLYELKDEDDLLIIYTSGTTGKPKGAVLSHKNIFMNAINMVLECALVKDEVQIISTPLFHIGGISAMTMLVLVGGRTILQRKFHPAKFMKTIESEKVTYTFIVPSMWNELFELGDFSLYDTGSIKKICTAGAATPLKLKRKIQAYFPNAGIFDTFGQTETASALTLKANDPIEKSGSVGQPFCNLEVRVVDKQMNDCKPGDIGEIVYRGPTIMKGYYKNKKATENAIKGGWFHSGDLVKLDNDGYITVVDRKNDMIISGGENIYPKEIEEVLYSHPDILEAAVIGVPDEKWGEAVKAFIVPRKNKLLLQQEIIDYCSERMAGYKKPKYIEFIDMLPKNASGKILKTNLRS